MSSPVIALPDAHCTPCARIATEFERDLVALVSDLRAFSRSLCRNDTLAEDVVQEALVRAWRHRDRFERGTNLKAWVFTILRHEFYSQMRRARRETTWDEVLGERVPGPAIEQEWAMELADCTRALGTLPRHQREAVMLIGAGGLTHDEAAGICVTSSGTMKSRTARGRASLLNILADSDLRMLPRARTPERNAFEFVLAELTALTTVAVGRTPYPTA